MRVLWWQTTVRNESEGLLGRLRCEPWQQGATSTDLEVYRKI